MKNKDYKDTLNLPHTSFPMKANLTQIEPKILKMWEDNNLYQLMQETFRGNPLFILHDGPPYANGHIHMGTALNKILKDFVVKSRQMMGFHCPYVPGWDCHGLPIEHQVDKLLGKKKGEMDKLAIRRHCRSYAEKYVNIQCEEFKRLGVSGDWKRPYLTMDPKYQATIVREFGKFLLDGSVYRSKKPVYWCPHCKTALAEAEVEYKEQRAPSIFVKFPLISKISDKYPVLKGNQIYVVIWTTTPWTLISNLAIALNPEFDYVAVRVNGEVLILSERLCSLCMEDFGYKDYKILTKISPKYLKGKRCKHPFIDRKSIIILASYVTLEAGTGCVHIAPGHGQEDYESGLSYNLEIYSPVDDNGCFTEDVPFFAGKFVFDANPLINEKLKEVGALIKEDTIVHSYPHCWRCKQPVILRATEQWFISVEKKRLRKNALEAIEKIKWFPQRGKERMEAMLAQRPDWCISRQRVWGVPITIFYCKNCGNFVVNKEIIDYVASLIEREGADCWFMYDAKELLPPNTTCPHCGGTEFDKESDILDVWFDSGVSHIAILEEHPYWQDLSWPADLYLEGSDQHRGWFQSSLLTSIGIKGKPPYKAVLTHGFVVDEQGKKMSKSLGNVIYPKDIIDKYGAEILRLWVAASDYQDDIKLSSRILNQLTDGYRKIRNTLRFILGNLYDFKPESHFVPYERRQEIDRYILHCLQCLITRIRKAYKNYQFHIVYHSLHNFCTVDLSAFYLDIIKDRLYTFYPDSIERRAAQTTLWELIEVIVRLMAPILAFTAEEIWQCLPYIEGWPKSVHLTKFPDVKPEYEDEDLERRWRELLAIRSEVNRALERARRNKLIGHSLDAEVIIQPSLTSKSILERYLKDLATIFIVSHVQLVDKLSEVTLESEHIPNLKIFVRPYDFPKCSRCWQHHPSVGKDPEYPMLCERCQQVMRLLK